MERIFNVVLYAGMALLYDKYAYGEFAKNLGRRKIPLKNCLIDQQSGPTLQEEEPLPLHSKTRVLWVPGL